MSHTPEQLREMGLPKTAEVKELRGLARRWDESDCREVTYHLSVDELLTALATLKEQLGERIDAAHDRAEEYRKAAEAAEQTIEGLREELAQTILKCQEVNGKYLKLKTDAEADRDAALSRLKAVEGDADALDHIIRRCLIGHIWNTAWSWDEVAEIYAEFAAHAAGEQEDNDG